MTDAGWKHRCDRHAARACDILVLLVTAAAREDDVRRATGHGTQEQRADELRDTFAALPRER